MHCCFPAPGQWVLWFATACFPLLAAGCQQADPARKPFTFGYGTGERVPEARGGTTRGAPVEPAPEPTPAWRSLREAGLDKRERDRRAILGLAGSYRVDFQFLETVGLAPGYRRAAPYRSWATERVIVVEQTPRRIVLQHVLCMYFVQEDGSVSEPAVVKHWRQDWTWEDRQLLVFRGAGRWAQVRVAPERAKGRWSQAVWGVADEPRYEALGRWRHTQGDSVWVSEPVWRPLPRREYTARDDYDVLETLHRHRVTPGGWTHEQRSRKLKLGPGGRPGQALAVELGLARYRALRHFAAAPARDYWARTAETWRAVRAAWAEAIARHGRFQLKKRAGGKHLVTEAFALADDPPEDEAAAAQALVARHLEPVREPSDPEDLSRQPPEAPPRQE